MGKAIFEVKSIVQHWGPPFGKEVSTEEISVSEGKSFDSHPKAGSIFKLVKLGKGKALVEFNEKFTLKGHEHPRNRQVWVDKLEPVSFTYLWGNDGMTKSLKLKEIVAESLGVQEESQEIRKTEGFAMEESKPISEEMPGLE